MSFIPAMRASNPFDRAGVMRTGHVTRGRIPGPTAACPDLGSLRKLDYVRQAWELSRACYLDRAIRDYAGDEFWQAVQVAIDPLLMAVGLVGGTEPVGASAGGAVVALGLGVGSMPVAMTGPRLGRDFGRGLLDWLGVGAHSEHVAGRLEAVGATLERGIRTAWNSGGSFTAMHAAAHDMADAFGIFFGLLLKALVAATSQVEPVHLSTRPPELGDKLEAYLRINPALPVETPTTGGAVKDPTALP
jgi:hypothetical protein